MNKNPIFCKACKFTKVNESEFAKVNVSGNTCAGCKEWLKDIQKSIKLSGYTTWPKLHEELRIAYAGVIRKLGYMVKEKILLPPDESGKYFLNKK